MKYKIEPILSGADIGRTKRCQHGAKPCEHCSTCDVGKRHVISLNDEELDVMLRALDFAADFQNDYYTLYPDEDYNRGSGRKQARGEGILADLRAKLGEGLPGAIKQGARK